MAKPTRKQRREGKTKHTSRAPVEPEQARARRASPVPQDVGLSKAKEVSKAEETPLPDPPAPIRRGPDMKWAFFILVGGAALYLLITYFSKPPVPADAPAATPSAPAARPSPASPKKSAPLEIPIEPADAPLPSAPPAPSEPSPAAPSASAPPPAAPPPPPTATAKATPTPSPTLAGASPGTAASPKAPSPTPQTPAAPSPPPSPVGADPYE